MKILTFSLFTLSSLPLAAMPVTRLAHRHNSANLGALRLPAAVQLAEQSSSVENLPTSGPVAPSTTLEHEVSVGSPRITGLIDLRPSWTTRTGEMHSEDELEVGYHFTPDTTLLYQQNIQTNLYDPTGKNRGMGAFATDGLFRLRVKRLWESERQGLAFDYEARAYLPTYAPSRDAGMITVVRNYFMLTKTVSPVVSVSLMDVPVAYFYSKAGYDGTANPLLENRVYVIADLSLTRKLSLSIPLMFHVTRYRDYAAGAAYNNSWGYILWTWPELSYELTSQMSVGVAYYSDNLIRPDLSGFALKKGLELGVAQVFLHSSL